MELDTVYINLPFAASNAFLIGGGRLNPGIRAPKTAPRIGKRVRELAIS